jgi:hypothetical protein
MIIHTEIAHAKTIVKLVGGHALALDIAGSYIHPSGTFREYHDDQLGGDSGDFSPKVWEEGTAAHNDRSATATYNLNRCFKASFDRLSGEAHRLLFLLSFLGNEDIPTIMMEGTGLKGIRSTLFKFHGVGLTYVTWRRLQNGYSRTCIVVVDKEDG